MKAYLEYKEVNGKKIKFDDYWKWEFNSVEAKEVAGDKTKIDVFRNKTRKAKVKIVRKQYKHTCDEMNLWIIWATMERTKVKGPYNKPTGAVYVISVNWEFKAIIEPKNIFDISISDVPKLNGLADKKTIPGGNKTHPLFKDLKLETGVKYRWDISRKWREKIKSPKLKTKDFGVGCLKLYAGLPSPDFKIAVDYPTDELIGNDDVTRDPKEGNIMPFEKQQDCYPYSINNHIDFDEPGKVGNLSSQDRPSGPNILKPWVLKENKDDYGTPGPNGTRRTLTAKEPFKDENLDGERQSREPFETYIDKNGNNQWDDGDTVELHMHFIEFVRLQIGTNRRRKCWYRISSFKEGEWRSVAIMKYRYKFRKLENKQKEWYDAKTRLTEKWKTWKQLSYSDATNNDW